MQKDLEPPVRSGRCRARTAIENMMLLLCAQTAKMPLLIVCPLHLWNVKRLNENRPVKQLIVTGVY